MAGRPWALPGLAWALLSVEPISQRAKTLIRRKTSSSRCCRPSSPSVTNYYRGALCPPPPPPPLLPLYLFTSPSLHLFLLLLSDGGMRVISAPPFSLSRYSYLPFSSLLTCQTGVFKSGLSVFPLFLCLSFEFILRGFFAAKEKRWGLFYRLCSANTLLLVPKNKKQVVKHALISFERFF